MICSIPVVYDMQQSRAPNVRMLLKICPIAVKPHYRVVGMSSERHDQQPNKPERQYLLRLFRTSVMELPQKHHRVLLFRLVGTSVPETLCVISRHRGH
jgi:hypothetical protein